LTYDEQKTLKEEKQAELTAKRQQLEAEKAVVTQKRAEQQALLDITNSSEQQYQDLLDQAQRELAALADSAFTGKKPVGKGEFIGLMGNTGFSKGAHLHLGYFNLTEDEHNGIFAGGIGWYSGRHIDPRGALQSRSLVSYDPSCPGQIGSGPGSWPLSDPYITQCYGVTPYSSVYSGNFHRGLDMSTKGSVAITAVEGGVAYFYRGATSFGNNVRVFHPDGKMTLYLHLQ
jgi:murein DD-endopeptidase MepM/ murein hydrolase activator NlpD